MSGLRSIPAVVDLVVFWSRPAAVVLLLCAVWLIGSASSRRLRQQCCKWHPGLSHEQWLSESNIPLLYATPLAFQVYGVQWLATIRRQRHAGMGALEWWQQLQPS